MRLRWFQSWTWVTALAVLGLLLHAGLLVRHGVQATQAGAADLVLTICHGDGTAPTETRWPQPGDPAGSQKTPCPVCTGALAGAAVLPAEAVLPLAWTFEAALDVGSALVIFPARTEVPPPGRGPPSPNA
jgi:hypothetical protein